MLRDGIRDDQWDRIKDLLPGRIGHVGATARNNRLFIDAVLYRIRTGISWCDLPERFGDFKNIHRRFSRWAEKGLWTNLLSLLTEDVDEEYVMIDLRHPLIFYSVILGRCFNKWESHEQDIFVHPKPPNWLGCASKIFRNQLPLDALSH